MERQRVTAIRVGENEEVTMEELLMKLAISAIVMKGMATYIETLEANHGECPDSIEPPNSWAIAGAFQSISEVSHYLKCACWGHKEAFRH